MKLSNHPVILTVCVHTGLVLALSGMIISDPGPGEAVGAVVIFFYLDLPSSMALIPIDAVLDPIINAKLEDMGLDYEFYMLSIGCTVLGGLQWGLVAWGCVRFKRWLRGRRQETPSLP